MRESWLCGGFSEFSEDNPGDERSSFPSRFIVRVRREGYIFPMKENLAKAKEVVKQWNECHGAFYQVRPNDLEWQFLEQSWLRYRVLELAGVPTLVASASPSGVDAGIAKDNLWISLYGKTPQPDAFVEAALALLRSEGKKKLVFGGDEFHLVSGVPKEDSSLLAALAAHGFQFADMVDYAGTVIDSDVANYCAEAERTKDFSLWRLEPATSEEQKKVLQDFLRKEFPGRWEREFRFWLSREGMERSAWLNLFFGKEDRPRGFARLSFRGEREGGWCPGALRLPAVAEAGISKFDSCLGPIGMASTERGKGNGRVLLGISLKYLLENHAQTVCIDWTNAYNYYMPLRLPVVRSYQSAWKQF